MEVVIEVKCKCLCHESYFVMKLLSMCCDYQIDCSSCVALKRPVCEYMNILCVCVCVCQTQESNTDRPALLELERFVSLLHYICACRNTGDNKLTVIYLFYILF